MEKAGETPIDEDKPPEVLGRVLITVYNDRFSVDSENVTSKEMIGLFYASADKLSASLTDKPVLH